MKKLLGLLAVALVIGTGLAFADKSHWDTPIAPDGSPDTFAGLKSSCTFNSSGVINMVRVECSTCVSGVLFDVVTSTGDVNDYYQVYDASTTVATALVTRLKPLTSYPVAAGTTTIKTSFLDGRGVRYVNGITVRLTNTADDASELCVYYLDH